MQKRWIEMGWAVVEWDGVGGTVWEWGGVGWAWVGSIYLILLELGRNALDVVVAAGEECVT